MLWVRRPPHNFDTYPSPVSSNSIFINALLLKLTSNQLWNNPPCTPLVQNSNLQMELWDQIDSLHCCSCNTFSRFVFGLIEVRNPTKANRQNFFTLFQKKKGCTGGGAWVGKILMFLSNFQNVFVQIA